MKKLKMTLVKTRKVWDEFFALFKNCNLHVSVRHRKLFDHSKAGMGGRMNKQDAFLQISVYAHMHACAHGYMEVRI